MTVKLTIATTRHFPDRAHLDAYLTVVEDLGVLPRTIAAELRDKSTASLESDDGRPCCVVASTWNVTEDAEQLRTKGIRRVEGGGMSYIPTRALDAMEELARRDDWHLHFVGSDIRQLISEVKLHRAEHGDAGKREDETTCFGGKPHRYLATERCCFCDAER